MPELPEVQTVVSGLQEKILNKRIVSLFEQRKGTIQNFFSGEFCEFGIVKAVKRRGKYIIIETSENIKLVIHLRMTGKLIFDENTNDATHSRAYFTFEDGSKMIFDDVRTFGKIQVFGIDDKVSSLEKLGVEPLLDEFDTEYLYNKIKKRKAPIKNLLLDQTIIAGLGNIYVCEVLYRVGVNPTSQGNIISKKKTGEIKNKIKEVLVKAIACNGTSISDYRNVDNKTGEFQKFLQVYGKEKCPDDHSVKRIKQAGRSTFFCPKCQK